MFVYLSGLFVYLAVPVFVYLSVCLFMYVYVCLFKVQQNVFRCWCLLNRARLFMYVYLISVKISPRLVFIKQGLFVYVCLFHFGRRGRQGRPRRPRRQGRLQPTLV